MLKRKKDLFFFVSLTLIIVGCDKLNLKWNLDRVPKTPTILSTGILNISNTGVSIKVTLQNDSLSEVSDRGICLSSQPNPDTNSIVSHQGIGTSEFICVIDNLIANTTYHVRSFAVNKVGVSYGEDLVFTTTNISASLPNISTNPPNSITPNSAIISAYISSDGGSSITISGMCFSTNQNPSLLDSYTTDGSVSGSFTSTLNSLNANTTYYARAYASNGIGTAYGNQVMFITSPSAAIVVETNNCSSFAGINSLYYGMNGTSAPWGISTNGSTGNCWSAPDPLNAGQLGTVVGSNHFVEFNRNFQNQGYIEFWVNTYNPGFNNLNPTISLNGSSIGTCTIIGGQPSSFYWMKVRSPILQAGSNTIRISFNGSYYELYVDEIEFFEY